MKTKTIVLLLVLCTIGLTLTSCGNNNSNEDSKTTIDDNKKTKEKGINSDGRYNGTYEWNCDDIWFKVKVKRNKWKAQSCLPTDEGLTEFNLHGVIEGEKLVRTDEYKGKVIGEIHPNGLRAYIIFGGNKVRLDPVLK